MAGALFVFVLLGFFIVYFNPPILGAWESLTYYFSHGTPVLDLSFRISPRANVGGQGYALLEVSRWFSDGAGWSLFAARLPSIAMGAVTLSLTFLIARRISGFWPALIATLFLGLNPVFQVYLHQLNVVIVTLVLWVALVERGQVLFTGRFKALSLLWLGIVCALLSLYHAMGRYYMVALIMIYLLQAWQSRRSLAGKRWQAGALVALGLAIFAAAYVKALRGLHSANLTGDFKPLLMNFFFPDNADEIQGVGPKLIKTLAINAHVLFESLTGLGHKYHSVHSQDLLADLLYPLLFPLVSIFFWAGVFVLLGRAIRTRFHSLDSHFIILPLLGMAVVLPLFSEVTTTGIITLSNYRLFYALFPIHLTVAVALDWLFRTGAVRPAWKWASAALISVTIVTMSVTLIQQQRALAGVVRSHVLNSKSGDSLAKDWVDAIPAFTSNRAKYERYLFLHLNYRKQAREIADRVGREKDLSGKGQVVIVPVDVGTITDVYSPEISGPGYLHTLNFHQVFLALYLSDEGTNVGFFQAVGLDTLPITGTGYVGPPRRFSEHMDRVNGKWDYVFRAPPEFILRKTQASLPEVVLTTTASEQRAAEEYMAQKGISYLVLAK